MPVCIFQIPDGPKDRLSAEVTNFSCLYHIGRKNTQSQLNVINFVTLQLASFNGYINKS